MSQPGNDDAAPRPTAGDAIVVVPVKAFDRAKVRLSDALDAPARARLARAMADRVVAAAAPLPVAVVCDDDVVAEWARSVGAAVVWTPGLGLNGAVAEAIDRLAGAGVRRAVIAHADLPFAAGLASFGDTGDDDVLLVPDRRRDGTNVMSVPTAAGFRFQYGGDSFARHLVEVERCGLRARVVEAEHLGWDIDEPADLDAPAHLGALPDVTSGPGRTT